MLAPDSLWNWILGVQGSQNPDSSTVFTEACPKKPEKKHLSLPSYPKILICLSSRNQAAEKAAFSMLISGLRRIWTRADLLSLFILLYGSLPKG